MREEEKVRQEIEKATREAERDEDRFNKALEQARNELSEARDQERDALQRRIEALQREISEAHARKERALSRAQLTRSGYVYIISNLGSFGEGIYKVGMSRRLEPLDRVRELGDASVPFGFDVHAMICSEDAPELESSLHQFLDARRLNLLNRRKEFFRVDLDEIERFLRDRGEEIQFTKVAEAEDYRRTLVMREARERTEPKEADAVADARETFERRIARWREGDSEAAPGAAGVRPNKVS